MRRTYAFECVEIDDLDAFSQSPALELLAAPSRRYFVSSAIEVLEGGSDVPQRLHRVCVLL